MLEDSETKQKALRAAKKAIPAPLFKTSRPLYHWCMAVLARIVYGKPSKNMKIIGVTGTKGKSTTALMIARIFEDQGKKVAMIGSLGYKIGKKEWPNLLKMTMPGRFKLQKFLHQASVAGCEYVAIEVTSEGIMQKRLVGIDVDCAVFTNLHREHIEAHGGFENYIKAKKILFQRTRNIHVINVENAYAHEFMQIPANVKLTFGLNDADITQQNLNVNLQLSGVFNVYNALAAISVAHVYGLDLGKARDSVEAIPSVPGRMEYIERGQPFEIIIDYAHTPESLEGVYQTLKPISGKLIGVLGAAGGGRDAWKRPVFGEIASRYCNEIILTNEDPYDEDPEKIFEDIFAGISQSSIGTEVSVQKITDRQEAIAAAIQHAKPGDTVVITGKGSETSIAIENGKKVPWSDKGVVEQALAGLGFTGTHEN